MIEQARFDKQFQVVNVRLQQKQIGELRLGRDLADAARCLGAHVIDQALTIGCRSIRNAAVTRIKQDAHGILQAAVRHPLDGLGVEQAVLQRADSCAGICVAWLLHTRPSHQPNSSSATFVSSLSRNWSRIARKEQSFS